VIGDDYSTVDGYVQLKDVALLAGIDEKTARNLANPQAKNRLVTEKWKGRTLVAIDVARNWLIQRGYQDTVEFDSMLDRDLATRGFWSLADLGEYVQGHREKSNMTIEALGAKAGLDSDGLVWLAALEAGHASFDKDRLQALAVALGIAPIAFVLAALKQIQSFQLRELEAQFAA
ncbi:MAG: helix-turn-helix transcriptional regulator, partial [Sideroxyarcus sp.]|nr:helix-turn-helix transcriptional regulator [Sideroxyarcus sp.]